ncbi:MAG: S8 family peptidase [Reichenbachiella sp.]|uniref:S8 family peptidase n=1 Tax=Reichenbachiella sp. TaxID=2184521 RepID=UPI003265109D
MARNKHLILWLALSFLSQWTQAQTDRYVVFFTDKDNTSYSVDAPSEFLSAKAITRRENQNIAISETDLPVNASYVESIKDLGADTYFTSKWMNAVLVEATADEIATIEDESFVLKTTLAAPGQKLSAEPEAENITRASNNPSVGANVNSNKQLSMLHANTMHDEGLNGEGIWVAVFDDGFIDANLSAAFSHTFEDDKLKDVFDFITGGKNVFQYDDHGTGSWSCFGANFNTTLVGTGYAADISLYVTEDVNSEYRIEEFNWLFAAERADSAGVDIITSSLGYSDFDDPDMDYTTDDLDGKTSIISQAANFAIERGILVVTSAGNSGNSADWPFISMPADVENIVSVGALDINYDLVSFSSIGPTADDRIKPEVVALGQEVTLLSEGNVITKKNGTSFSAPLIAGFAAAIWQKFPDLTNLELRDLLLSSSDNFNNPNNQIGYGIPDYNVAVGNEPLAVSDLIDESITIYPNPVTGDHVNLLIEQNLDLIPVKFKLYSSDGQLISEKTIKKARKGVVEGLPFNQGGPGLYFLSIESKTYSKIVKLLRY